MGAGNLRRRPQRVLGGAGEVVLAGQQIERADAGIDRLHLLAQVTVDAIEIEIAFEDAGPALHVHPQRLVAADRRALRCDQAGDQRRAHLAAMDVRTMQPRRVVPGLLEVGGLQGHQRTELGGMGDREIEHDAATDRAAHHHRLVEFHGLAEGPDGGGVGGCRQPVFGRLPTGGRCRLAVPGHVEGQHAVAAGDFRVCQQVAELAVVGAGRVQADEGNALSRFLEIDAMRHAVDIEPHVPADHGIENGRHFSWPPAAGEAAPAGP